MSDRHQLTDSDTRAQGSDVEPGEPAECAHGGSPEAVTDDHWSVALRILCSLYILCTEVALLIAARVFAWCTSGHPHAQEVSTVAVRRLTYEQIADDIAARIAGGEYPPHTRLPSTRQLADLYSVSAGTIAKVQIVLRTRGLTYGIPGGGVFIEGPDA